MHPFAPSIAFTRAFSVLALTASLSSPAAAATLTMQGWFHGAGQAVSVTSPNYNGLAGGFKGTLQGLSDSRFNLADLEMYCVDLLQTINPAVGTRYSVKMAGEAGASTFEIKPIEQVFAADRVARLVQLVSFVEASPMRVDSAAESTALQLAIWNILYDTDASLHAQPGATFSDTSSHRSYASDLLAQSVGFGATRQLFVMTSSQRQDQLFWLDAHRVPEPSAALLALAALGAIGVAGRRSRR